MGKRKTTYDHEEIRNWVESNRGKPAFITGAEPARALDIHFSEGKSDRKNAREVDWEVFFSHFDKAILAFQYEEPDQENARPFYKFVGRTL